MIFTTTPVTGAFVIELEPKADDRGSFARSFCRREFAAHGIEFSLAQCNLARSLRAGIVRGLHYQEPPAAEQKLVRCMAGEVFDVIVDMRPESASYLKHFHLRLNPVDRSSLFIPAGVAHGYQVLADNTEFFYMTDEFYSPGHEKGVRFDDPALAIPWPLPVHQVTERDRAWPLLLKPIQF